MTDWEERAGDLLFGGERVAADLAVSGGRVVVTSHRVLAFRTAGATDGADGDGADRPVGDRIPLLGGSPDPPPFEAVDLPNVRGVGVESVADRPALWRAVRFAAYGLPSLVVGALFGVDGAALLNPAEWGELSGTIRTVATLLSVLDELLIALGLACLAVAAVAAWRYRESRTEAVVVAVAGDEDVAVPAVDADEAAVADLDAATDPRSGGRGNRDGGGSAEGASESPEDAGGSPAGAGPSSDGPG